MQALRSTPIRRCVLKCVVWYFCLCAMCVCDTCGVCVCVCACVCVCVVCRVLCDMCCVICVVRYVWCDVCVCVCVWWCVVRGGVDWVECGCAPCSVLKTRIQPEGRFGNKYEIGDVHLSTARDERQQSPQKLRWHSFLFCWCFRQILVFFWEFSSYSHFFAIFYALLMFSLVFRDFPQPFAIFTDLVWFPRWGGKGKPRTKRTFELFITLCALLYFPDIRRKEFVPWLPSTSNLSEIIVFETPVYLSDSISFGSFRSTSSLHSSTQLLAAGAAGPYCLRNVSQCLRRQTRQVRLTRSNLASHVLATDAIGCKSWRMRGFSSIITISWSTIPFSWSSALDGNLALGSTEALGSKQPNHCGLALIKFLIVAPR